MADENRHRVPWDDERQFFMPPPNATHGERYFGGRSFNLSILFLDFGTPPTGRLRMFGRRFEGMVE